MAGGVEVGIRTMEQAVMVCNGLLKEVHKLQAENERLKAEVERLRAALTTDHVCRVCNDYLERDRDVCGVCYDTLEAQRDEARTEVERMTQSCVTRHDALRTATERLQRYEAVVEAAREVRAHWEAPDDDEQTHAKAFVMATDALCQALADLEVSHE